MWRSFLLAAALSGSQFILVTPGAHLTIGSHYFHRIWAEGRCGTVVRDHNSITCIWAPKNWAALTGGRYGLTRRPVANHRRVQRGRS